MRAKRAQFTLMTILPTIGIYTNMRPKKRCPACVLEKILTDTIAITATATLKIGWLRRKSLIAMMNSVVAGNVTFISWNTLVIFGRI